MAWEPLLNSLMFFGAQGCPAPIAILEASQRVPSRPKEWVSSWLPGLMIAWTQCRIEDSTKASEASSPSEGNFLWGANPASLLGSDITFGS